LDERLKKMMKELGDAINESLSDSEEIAEVISRIKDSGYDIFLVLEATIGFNKRDEEDEAQAGPDVVTSIKEPEFAVNAQDMKFLRSLRIAIDDAA
jgi:hypothetical protein